MELESRDSSNSWNWCTEKWISEFLEDIIFVLIGTVKVLHQLSGLLAFSSWVMPHICWLIGLEAKNKTNTLAFCKVIMRYITVRVAIQNFHFFGTFVLPLAAPLLLGTFAKRVAIRNSRRSEPDVIAVEYEEKNILSHPHRYQVGERSGKAWTQAARFCSTICSFTAAF